MKTSFFQRYKAFIRLMRLNNLSGFFLLLWPTIWSLWIATYGKPNHKQVIIFVFGCFFTRTFGCIINDIIDHKIDKKIHRTKNRPLPQNLIRLKEAFFTFLIFVVLSFIIIFFLNIKSFFLSILVLILICTYPKLKLHSYFPQIFLGITFSCSILMVYAATQNDFPITCWLLFIANTAWTTAYDTQYALLDLNNDILYNIKSTAVFFKKKSKNFILLLQFLMLLIFIIVGYIEQLGIIFYFSLILSSVVFYVQNVWISKNSTQYTYCSFLSNNIVGMIIFFGILFGI